PRGRRPLRPVGVDRAPPLPLPGAARVIDDHRSRTRRKAHIPAPTPPTTNSSDCHVVVRSASPPGPNSPSTATVANQAKTGAPAKRRSISPARSTSHGSTSTESTTPSGTGTAPRYSGVNASPTAPVRMPSTISSASTPASLRSAIAVPEEVRARTPVDRDVLLDVEDRLRDVVAHRERPLVRR